MLDEVEAVARAAALAGGDVLRTRYRDGDADGQYGPHDVKAAADVASEDRILAVVRRAFPDHAIFSEEAGTLDGDGYRWVIDPLDGTNDFAAGMPTFSTSVAVLRDGEPVLAVVHLPVTGETYVARRGAGVRYEGEHVTADSPVPVEAATVAIVVGREIPRDPDLAATADAMAEVAGERVKRVVDTWAPTVHAGLVARGRMQGLVQFHPDEEEQHATELLAAEADAATRRDGPLFVAACDEETLDALWTGADVVR